MAPMALPFKPSSSALPQYVVSRRPLRRGHLPLSSRMLRFRKSAAIILVITLFCLWLFIPRRSVKFDQETAKMLTQGPEAEGLPPMPDDYKTDSLASAAEPEPITHINSHGAKEPNQKDLGKIATVRPDDHDQGRKGDGIEEEAEAKAEADVQILEDEEDGDYELQQGDDHLRPLSDNGNGGHRGKFRVDANEIKGASRTEAYREWEDKVANSAIDTAALAELVRRVPVVVFSKTTCPFSKKAKDLLSSMNLLPPPYIVEADLLYDTALVKSLLAELTKHSTFPNIFIGGKSIGGADDLTHLATRSELRQVLFEAGVSVQNDPVLS